MKEATPLPSKLPYKPTPSDHPPTFFHAQYIKRSEHYAMAGLFDVSWLFLFGLFALGLGIAYWSFAAWETYFSFDPYFTELRYTVAIANAVSAIAITLVALLMQQVLLRPLSAWTQKRQIFDSVLLLVWWLTTWVGLGLPLGSWSGTVAITSVAALLLLMDNKLDILMGKKAPWIGFSALILGALLSYQMIGALLWYAAPWLSLVMGVIVLRTWPYKDDIRAVTAMMLLLAFSFGPCLTGTSQYTGFLSLARYKTLSPQAGKLALQKLKQQQATIHPLRFYSILYAFTKHNSLQPEATKLLLSYWKKSDRPFPKAFLRWRSKPLHLSTLFMALEKDQVAQKRLVTELIRTQQSPQDDDARWLLRKLAHLWPNQRKTIHNYLSPKTPTKRGLPPRWQKRTAPTSRPSSKPAMARVKPQGSSNPAVVRATSRPAPVRPATTRSVQPRPATPKPTIRHVASRPVVRRPVQTSPVALRPVQPRLALRRQPTSRPVNPVIPRLATSRPISPVIPRLATSRPTSQASPKPHPAIPKAAPASRPTSTTATSRPR
ncbi:MAG: hypothetical protein H6728_02740 [Myxococcales bacterium]|nr:hypothetical protein [Myxococcales bacterium]